MTLKTDARTCKLNLLQESLREVFTSLGDSVQCGFPVMFCSRSLICHPAIFSYFCDILEVKDLSDVRHGSTMCTCICCLIKKHDISELKRGQVRTGEQMYQIYNKHDVCHEEYDSLVNQGRTRDVRSKVEEGLSLLNRNLKGTQNFSQLEHCLFLAAL